MNDTMADIEYLPPSMYFADKGALVVSRLAQVIKDAGHLRCATDGRVWRYDSGVYRPDGDLYARAQVRVLLGEKFRRSYVDEVLTWLKSFEPTITDQHNPDIINVANGSLDWRSGKLRPHDPEIVSTIQIPVRWDPDAFCPAILQFLTDVLPKDAVEFVLEIIGYALLPANFYSKAVLLAGPGGNGKSRLLSLIRSLLGSANVVAVSLQQLSENRFALADLYGQLANICGDLDARAVKRSDTFKMLTSGDAVTAERKFGHPFTYTPICLLLFSANEAPLSADQSQAWFDRWLVIPMERRFRDTDDDDPEILDKLIVPAELEGLLVEAVAGLRRLVGRGRFELPDSVVKAGEHYRDRLDSVRAFIDEMCELDPDAWVSRPYLYRAYREWCQDGGRYSLSAASFNERLALNYSGQVDMRTREGGRGWRGLRLADGGEAL